ncbi:MAG TPA: tRNA lysidine(34) synthetase TilS [Elusimicrobia bacterium]|nr:tRNA lysidine(34) synthetase TilS [Elusimicrobiota bacterium]HBT60970.1 tRNA lysidine(34) synthetase TilS [Elusimicrobiota bacterium]
MRRKEFAARIWSKLVACNKASCLLIRGDRVLAAVSGGPDSVCLAHFLREMGRRQGFQVRLLHIHHGLRGREADQDAAFVLKLGADWGMDAFVVKVPVRALAQKRGQGLEDAGRKLRYEALLKEARRLRCNKIATGHHLDDQAETVLLNLLRGTRLAALGGMPARRGLSGRVDLVRPLLPLSRKEIMAYLKVHGLRHRLDRSNQDPKFTRNWIRRRVLPLLESRNPRVREHLAGIAAQARSLGQR